MISLQEQSKKVTESITFRLEKSFIDKLKDDSGQKQISLNSLVGHIFKQYLDWNSNAGRALLVPFPRALLVKIMDKMSDEEIVDLAKYIADEEIEDIILLLKSNYTPQSFLDVIVSWLDVSNMPYRHSENGAIHSYVIQHDMSKKWSLYLGELFKHVFENLLKRRFDYTITKNTIAFKVDLGKD